MTTERQSEILNAIVREYISSAQPISSRLLEKKYDFEICPATIRIEMQKLTDAGFIFQPHTSAGRVPTDKGYRFFVDKLPEKELSEHIKDFEIEKWFEKEIEDTVKFIQSFTKHLASASSALALSYLPKEKILWKEGWENVLEEPEFREADYIFNFAKLLKNFEENIGDFEVNSKIHIYIGKENPFLKTKDFSIISSRCHFPEKDYNPPTASSHRLRRWAPGIVSLLGPKRMAYDKNISLINSLTKLLEKF